MNKTTMMNDENNQPTKRVKETLKKGTTDIMKQKSKRKKKEKKKNDTVIGKEGANPSNNTDNQRNITKANERRNQATYNKPQTNSNKERRIMKCRTTNTKTNKPITRPTVRRTRKDEWEAMTKAKKKKDKYHNTTTSRTFRTGIKNGRKTPQPETRN